ncbi:SHOCT domain-containing protein [Halococcus agarilyticus]|uniref:SHOCT domain-containing protein n=1 Tax=Halococcus agarilyticus TaxID=1232219 RepID=UPI000677F9DC|nr:SHOCT domain-containing protein [Halococcus agarilyticus]
MTTTARERFRENATGITSTVVTGVWLVALFTGQSWWLAALLFGYIVVVPVVSMLFGDDEDWEEHADEERADDEHWEDGWTGGGWTTEDSSDEPPETDNRDALETLRNRYARGELTDEQFERKVERLLDTDSLEAVEDQYRERERLRE